MTVTFERGLWMHVNRRALDEYMRANGISNRQLSRMTGGRIGPAIIGHLRSGRRSTCSPETARAIREATREPMAMFFTFETATASRRTSQPRRAA
ncbi:hypothetical protein RFH55_10010 [Cutibacterium avidum]|uniref:hypothetical protein n=1 Tax=Cutibacterium avidum TaxID=33010 RepID=UPI00280FFB82|nr:hypothetical protein [Cutibacterium avidum]MDQ9075855.1 hypothetical protein [Cutibacterium avidum]MDU4679043.1 hypothetical protein [Cutibacterium avidum]